MGVEETIEKVKEKRGEVHLRDVQIEALKTFDKKYAHHEVGR